MAILKVAMLGNPVLRRKAATIKDALHRHIARDLNHIDIDINHATVTVSGKVHSWAEWRAVIGAARGTRWIPERRRASHVRGGGLSPSAPRTSRMAAGPVVRSRGVAAGTGRSCQIPSG